MLDCCILVHGSYRSNQGNRLQMMHLFVIPLADKVKSVQLNVLQNVSKPGFNSAVKTCNKK